MADYTQTNVEVLDKQAMTHPASVVGSAVSVAGYLGGTVYIYQANIETTANLAAGLDYIQLQVSPEASGNAWYPYATFAPSTTASESEALTATEPVGETVLALASTTNLDASDYVYLLDNAGVDASEWAQIVSIVANTSVTIASGLIAEKNNADVLYDQACRWAVSLDFAGVSRIRVVVVHQGATGSDWHVWATMTAATAIE